MSNLFVSFHIENQGYLLAPLDRLYFRFDENKLEVSFQIMGDDINVIQQTFKLARAYRFTVKLIQNAIIKNKPQIIDLEDGWRISDDRRLLNE